MTRQLRGLLFEDEPPAPLTPLVENGTVIKTVDKPNYQKTVVREGDHLIETVVRKRKATIDFKKIAACGRIAPDDHQGPPWLETDCWPHEVIMVSQYAAMIEDRAFERFQEKHGEDVDANFTFARDALKEELKYSEGHYYDDGDMLVVVLDEHLERIGRWEDWWRSRGCTKQVASEIHADWLHDYIRQIVEWRRDGWYYYGGIFEMDDPVEIDESCWGCDSEETAQEYVDEQIMDAIDAVRKIGYTVTNVPDEYRPKTRYKNGKTAAHYRYEWDSAMRPFKGEPQSEYYYKLRHARRHTRKKTHAKTTG